MPRIKVKQVDQISRTTVSCAFTNFMRHCKLKNLSPYSYLYYDKNISFFLAANPGIKYTESKFSETKISIVIYDNVICVKILIGFSFLFSGNDEAVFSQ